MGTRVNMQLQQAAKAIEEKNKREQEAAAKQRRMATNQEIEAGAGKYAEDVRKRYAELTPEQITQVSTTGPAEMQDILARRQSALAGYQAPELAAMQSQMAGTQQAAQQQRERALQAALAKQGVRGGAAASLQAQASQMAAREQAQQATDLMLKQAQRQREALGEYETGVQGALQAEQSRLASELGVKLAAEQAAEAERARLFQEESQRQYSEDQKEAAKAGGKVICTELYEQGLMTKEIYEADQIFGQNLWKQSPETMIGYHFWAIPVVSLMKKSKVATFITHKIATPWAKQMAYEMCVTDKPSLIGSLLMGIGLPLCHVVGTIVKKLNYKTA